ncbi:hypothetical protein FQN54_003856 [Arachnomyces sp. PD_36]|nr:hypothetical protein FQN54_003856 [Arachnomyces sp. PD_36]
MSHKLNVVETGSTHSTSSSNSSTSAQDPRNPTRNGPKPSGRPVIHNGAHHSSDEKRPSGYNGGKWK